MRIFVVTHKQADTPPHPLYGVISVGGAPVPRAEFSDSTGDSISDKNRHYCELTALYWLWKNSRETPLGVCHYRRFFNFLPTDLSSYPLVRLPRLDSESMELLADPAQAEAISRLVHQYDLVVPRALYVSPSIGADYVRSHGRQEWDEFLRQLDDLYGAERHSAREETRFFGNNMLICRREIFDLYVAQLFHVIDRVFSAVGVLPDVAGARYQPGRYPGYLAERFMSAFINANRLKFFEAQVIHFDSV